MPRTSLSDESNKQSDKSMQRSEKSKNIKELKIHQYKGSLGEFQTIGGEYSRGKIQKTILNWWKKLADDIKDNKLLQVVNDLEQKGEPFYLQAVATKLGISRRSGLLMKAINRLVAKGYLHYKIEVNFSSPLHNHHIVFATSNGRAYLEALLNSPNVHETLPPMPSEADNPSPQDNEANQTPNNTANNSTPQNATTTARSMFYAFNQLRNNRTNNFEPNEVVTSTSSTRKTSKMDISYIVNHR